MSEADVQASAATIESPTINGGGENGLSKKPLEEADTSDVPIASGGTEGKGANGILDAALTEGKEALSEVVSAATKVANGVNGDLGNVAVNGLLVDAKDVEVKIEEAEDVSLSKNEEPVSVPEPSGTEADSGKDAAADVVKPEENSEVVPVADATETVLSKAGEPVTEAVPEVEQMVVATSSPAEEPTQAIKVEDIDEATQVPTVEANDLITAVDVPEEKVITPTVEETAPVVEETTPSVVVDATEAVPLAQTPAPNEVVEAPITVEEPVATPQVIAEDIPAEDTKPAEESQPALSTPAEPEAQVVPEAITAPIEDVSITITNDVEAAPEAPIPEAKEVPLIPDSALEAVTVAAVKPVEIEAPVEQEPIKEVAPPIVDEPAPESAEEVSTKPDVVEVIQEAESVHVATPKAAPVEAVVGLVVEDPKIVAEAPLVVEATLAEEPSTVVAAEEPVEPTKEHVEKVDMAEEVPAVEELKPADVFEPIAPVVAEVVQATPDLVEEEVKPSVEETEPVEDAKPVVEEKAVVEEDAPVVSDEVNTEEARPVSEEKHVEEPVEATPIVEDETPVVHDVIPEVVKEAPVVEEIPVVEEKETVVADEEPIVKEEPSVPEAEVLEEAKPFVQDETTVIEEKLAVEEAKPPIQEEVEAVEEPAVQEELAVQVVAAAEEETPLAQSIVVPEPDPVVENLEPAQEEPKVVDDVTPVEEAEPAKPAEDLKVEEANEDVRPLDAVVSDNDASPPVLNVEEEPKPTPEENAPIEAANVEDTKSVEEEVIPAVEHIPAEATPLVESPPVAEAPVAPKTVEEEPEPVKVDVTPVVESAAEADAILSPPAEITSEDIEPAVYIAESLPVPELEPTELAPSVNSVETEELVAVVAADEDVKPINEESAVVTEVEDVPTPEEAEPIQKEVEVVEEEVKAPEPEVLLATPATIAVEETAQDTPEEQAPLVEEIKLEAGAEQALAEVDVPTEADVEVASASETNPEIVGEQVALSEPALASEESTDSSSLIPNVDSAASDPEVEESVVVPIEEEMVFAPREEEVKSPKEKRSSSIDVVREASLEETTVDAVSPPTDSSDANTSAPSEPPTVIVDEPAVSVEEVPSSSEVASDPIERPKSPWTPSYSVMQVGSGVEVVDQVSEEDPPVGDLTSPVVPKTEVSEPERPSSTWTPSYSTTSQGSRSPSPLPDVEQPATEPLSEVTAVEDIPTVVEAKSQLLADVAEPPSIMITSQPQSDEAEAPPALEVETKVEQDIPERPKSPWTPSYSVTTQGSPLVESAELPHPPIESDTTPAIIDDVSSPVPPPVVEVVELPVPEVAESMAEVAPQPINVEPVSSHEEDEATTVEPVLDAEPSSVLGSSTDEPEEVQHFSESSVDAEQAPPVPEAIVAPVPERPKSPWTPSYSVTRQGSTPPSPEPAPTELVVNADIDAQSDIAAASLATEGPSSPRSTLVDLDSDTFSDVSDQRIPDSEETQPAVVRTDVDNLQDVEASSQTPVLSSAQLAEETVTTPTEEVLEPSVTITVDEPVVESNPQTPRNEPSEEPQAFPASTKPSVSRLDTSGESHELDASSTLETPAQSRKRLESTASSRFFPGGWFSTSPTIGGRTSLENAQGEFSALKSPIDMAGTTAPATTPIDGLAEDEERKSRWCTIM
ncbi:hypothetical protein PLEOSDRAFT_1097798 [Pleurotus ostreatus PC15]|uniref:Uncharacterized protein n=1 Tax=Pleurotus ostreatus (strain PC15) TaxID=1137138 RepID=A0A067NKN5_PLEO1|nr:hypothetical protein PLEOSDRAFT_1097798 [Pleurotus ostreatus PC15]